ncbi:hypothetical protein KEM52_005596 [Ascosphaera acerosa]|nr:hypothetical protein KEM52_005596 [Ascosphaera acerosa]
MASQDEKRGDVTLDSKLPEANGFPKHGSDLSESVVDVEKGTAQNVDNSHYDIALETLQKYAGDEPLTLTKEDNDRIVRIIDWHLMPIMCFVYALNFLDKTTLSSASIMGLREDLHLVGDNYQWLGSVFYFGFLGFEFPAARALQYLPIAKFSAICIVCWGIVLTCFAASKDFGGAMTCRLLLGIFEASVTPAFTLITARTLFILFGLLTVVLGVAFWWVIPDSQLNARWLSERDRALAVERIRENQQGTGTREFKWYQVKEALLDPIVWTFALVAVIAEIPNGGLTNFFSQLIVGMGFSAEQSLLLGVPAGFVEVVTIVASAWLGTRWKSGQLFCASIFGWIGVLGAILLIALPEHMKAGRLIGYYLTLSYVVMFVCLLGMISSNIAGYTKKTVSAGIYMSFYSAGNIIGPQTFRPKDAPQYVPAKITILVCFAAQIVLLYLVWWYLALQNKKKEKIRSAPDYVKVENSEFMDLTDRENPEFVYIY